MWWYAAGSATRGGSFAALATTAVVVQLDGHQSRSGDGAEEDLPPLPGAAAKAGSAVNW